jgi:hypothetical protein
MQSSKADGSTTAYAALAGSSDIIDLSANDVDSQQAVRVCLFFAVI